MGSFGPARGLHAAGLLPGRPRSARPPTPTRASARLARGGSGLEGPVGTRRRAAAAGRENQPGSLRLPAATLIVLCTLGLGSK